MQVTVGADYFKSQPCIERKSWIGMKNANVIGMARANYVCPPGLRTERLVSDT